MKTLRYPTKVSGWATLQFPLKQLLVRLTILYRSNLKVSSTWYSLIWYHSIHKWLFYLYCTILYGIVFVASFPDVRPPSETCALRLATTTAPFLSPFPFGYWLPLYILWGGRRRIRSPFVNKDIHKARNATGEHQPHRGPTHPEESLAVMGRHVRALAVSVN